MEEWKDIKGYEGIYQVSNFGRVRSVERKVRANICGFRIVKEKILSMCKSKNGYYTVVLSKSGKNKSLSIHRLVAKEFIDNPKQYKEVNHKDENKLNNCVENLEWCNRKYNANYGTSVERCAKTKFKPVYMIDVNTHEILRTFDSLKRASQETGISNKNISSVCLHKSKTAGGYSWRFVYGN